MDLSRYQRQIILPEIGKQGQKLLSRKTVLIVGCGGLGSNSSEILTRLGIGTIILVDDDTIHQSNLHRTSLFSEQDVGKPKVTRISDKLKLINSSITIKAYADKISKHNIESLTHHIDVILDGTDNLPTRFLLNDISLKKQIPWVYAGIYATVGMVMGIIPYETACLQCLTTTTSNNKKEIPVLGNLPLITAGIQCTEIVKILLDKKPAGLIIYDIWKQNFDHLQIKKNPHCICCGKQQK
jgi:molybdopterin-synthase adenylyltransferase